MSRKLTAPSALRIQGDDVNTKKDYARLAQMGNPAQELALRGIDTTEALKVPDRKPVPGRRGDLTEMTARDFLRRGFPNMSRKDRRKLEATMTRRDKAGLDPLTGLPVEK